MNDRRPGPGEGEGRHPGVGEETEDGHRSVVAVGSQAHADRVLDPAEHRRVLREDPQVTRIGRASLQGEAADRRGPWSGYVPTHGRRPSAVAVEPQVRGRPAARLV